MFLVGERQQRSCQHPLGRCLLTAALSYPSVLCCCTAGAQQWWKANERRNFLREGSRSQLWWKADGCHHRTKQFLQRGRSCVGWPLACLRQVSSSLEGVSCCNLVPPASLRSQPAPEEQQGVPRQGQARTTDL